MPEKFLVSKNLFYFVAHFRSPLDYDILTVQFENCRKFIFEFTWKEMDEFLLLSAICKDDLNNLASKGRNSELGLELTEVCGGVEFWLLFELLQTWALNWRICWSFNFNWRRDSSNSWLRLERAHESLFSLHGVEGKDRQLASGLNLVFWASSNCLTFNSSWPCKDSNCFLKDTLAVSTLLFYLPFQD